MKNMNHKQYNSKIDSKINRKIVLYKEVKKYLSSQIKMLKGGDIHPVFEFKNNIQEVLS